MKRAAPVLALLLLAPWVGEFLLGNISVRQLPALLILTGCGAVLIRARVYGSERFLASPGQLAGAAAVELGQVPPPSLAETGHQPHQTAKIRVVGDPFPSSRCRAGPRSGSCLTRTVMPEPRQALCPP